MIFIVSVLLVSTLEHYMNIGLSLTFHSSSTHDKHQKETNTMTQFWVACFLLCLMYGHRGTLTAVCTNLHWKMEIKFTAIINRHLRWKIKRTDTLASHFLSLMEAAETHLCCCSDSEPQHLLGPYNSERTNLRYENTHLKFVDKGR